MRQFQSSYFKLSSHRVIDSVTIDLRFMTNQVESNVLIFPMESCGPGASLEVTVQGEILSEETEDETASINSDSSSGTLSSVLGLNFSSKNALTSLSKSFGFGSRGKTEVDGNDSKMGDGGSGVDDDSFENSSGVSLDSSHGKASARKSFSSPASAGAVPTALPELLQEDDLNCPERRDHVAQLELKLLRQQRQHDEERRRLREQLEALKASSTKQIDSLTKELSSLKDNR